MVVKGVELIMSRRQIDAMIEADPVDVIFLRRTKVPTPSGGYTLSAPTPLSEAQEVRLIPFKRRMTEFLNNTELGDLPDLPYIILGRHDLDCERDDLFSINGQDFQVKSEDIGEPEVKSAFQVDYFGGGGVNA
jgi:hypothetical protein